MLWICPPPRTRVRVLFSMSRCSNLLKLSEMSIQFATAPRFVFGLLYRLVATTEAASKGRNARKFSDQARAPAPPRTATSAWLLAHRGRPAWPALCQFR